MLNLKEHPHRRFNPLTREWVLVSPHRTQRPWGGQTEEGGARPEPEYDPSCYLCPGNSRAGGARNPRYEGTFVFDNDFAALFPDLPEHGSTLTQGAGDLVVAQGELGICRVVCFSPRHDRTLALMETTEIRRVVDVWAEQSAELGAIPAINHVQIFENRGAMMGCSNPHPHGQIWAGNSLPNEHAKELAGQGTYWAANGRCLLCDYLALEDRCRERLVDANDHFAVIVPFWALWPFETLLVSRRHLSSLDQLCAEERDALADMLRRITTRYDNLFETSFPYSMGFHQCPTDGLPHPEQHLHAHYYPPLLRSAAVRKFMVGYELLANPQRDITPETAAERLRT